MRRRAETPAAGAGVEALRAFAPFWSKVSVLPNGCWSWTAYVRPNGYGTFGAGRLAHRVAYQVAVGTIPDGLQLDHLCRKRSCVNPQHLEPVSPRENVLRGVGLPAANVAKSQCRRGHSYEGENLYVDATGRRHCRACRAEQGLRSNRKRYARLRLDPEWMERERARNRERMRRKSASHGS